MYKQFFIDENEIGRCLVLTGPWSDSLKSLISKEDISALRLSQSVGWSCDDISFVKDLPELRGIEIYSWGVKDITPLETLKNLEYLGLQCEFTKSPDFSKFSKLKVCKLQWRPKAKTILECRALNLLNIINYPLEDLKSIQSMSELRRLQITSKKLTSLSGVENLSSLLNLDLYNCPKLESLSGIDMCKKMEVLEVEGCRKLYDVDLLGEVTHLKNLVLNDCGKIKSLIKLSNCQSIESINFAGDTIVEDGIFTSLLQISTLRKMWFTNQRHYSHKREQVLKLLS